MKKIHRWLLALALVFLSLPAIADGEWVFTDPPVIPSADGSLVRNPSASIRGDWRQPRTLQGVSTSLPNRLPGMGSRKEMLDYIVSSNNMSMNIYVWLLTEGPDGVGLSTGRWSYGFASYADCLRDLAIGMEKVFNKFKTNRLDPSSLVYARVYITYFNGDGSTDAERGNGLALSVYNPVDRFDSISLEKIMGAIEINDPIMFGQVIVRVPRLDGINIKVEVAGGVAELDWSASAGAQPSSLWRQYSVREWTTPTYLYLRDWYCDGSKPARVMLRSSGGEVATYTEFGDNLANIELRVAPGALYVLHPRGASVDLQWSAELQTWNPFKTVTVGSEPTIVPLTQPLGRMMFFRGGEAF